MKLGAGHPMGPFELFDYIGHDTMDLIMQVPLAITLTVTMALQGWSGRYPQETLFTPSPTIQVRRPTAERTCGFTLTPSAWSVRAS